MVTQETVGKRSPYLQIWQVLRFYEEGVIPEPLPICPDSGKVSYRRRKFAVRACKWLASRYGDDGLMPYRCRYSKANPKRCDQWHIGHPWWVRRGFKKRAVDAPGGLGATTS